jgi:hypothetical protein
MNTQEIREHELTLVIEGDKLFNFIKNKELKVRIHQDNFKDDYLSQPPIEEMDEIDELYLELLLFLIDNFKDKDDYWPPIEEIGDDKNSALLVGREKKVFIDRLRSYMWKVY